MHSFHSCCVETLSRYNKKKWRSTKKEFIKFYNWNVSTNELSRFLMNVHSRSCFDRRAILFFRTAQKTICPTQYKLLKTELNPPSDRSAWPPSCKGREVDDTGVYERSTQLCRVFISPAGLHSKSQHQTRHLGSSGLLLWVIQIVSFCGCITINYLLRTITIWIPGLPVKLTQTVISCWLNQPQDSFWENANTVVQK